MIKVITALGNENIYLNLKKEKDINIISEDIQYKEGIIEILEKYQDVDFIILNSLLIGEISLKDIINYINNINKKIKIIIFLENPDEEIKKYLYEKKIYKIIYNDEIEIKDLIKIIKEEELNNEDLKEEIEELKRIINNNNYNYNKENKNIINKKDKIKNKLNKVQNNELKINIKNKLKNKFNLKKDKKLFNNNLNFQSYNTENNFIQNRNCKIICIIGPPGVGKSIISINLAKSNMYDNKILIIDSDYINNSIATILGIKKYNKNNKYNSNNLNNNLNYLEEIIKINKKIDLINIKKNINLNNPNNYFNNLINKIKNNYDYIIIDTNSIELIENNKELINLSNFTLFISDTNLLEINKAIRLLDKYINKFNINKNKFNILFNKINSKSIDKKLLKNIFSEFKVIGFFSYYEEYNKIINKNNKNNLYSKKIRKEYINLNLTIKNLIN